MRILWVARHRPDGRNLHDYTIGFAVVLQKLVAYSAGDMTRKPLPRKSFIDATDARCLPNSQGHQNIVVYPNWNWKPRAREKRLRKTSLADWCTAAWYNSILMKAPSRLEVSTKTQGEIEAAICEGVARFEQDYMGRGPKDIRAHLFGDMLLVRLKGVLTAAEQHLVQSLPVEKGRDLLKQVRTHLVETARPLMEAMVEGITGVKVVSLHHDISTMTGEEIVVFTLADPPAVRDGKKK